jgi:hypothetical protein
VADCQNNYQPVNRYPTLFTWPLQAGVQIDIVTKFQNADLEFDVVTVIRFGGRGIKKQSSITGYFV